MNLVKYEKRPAGVHRSRFRTMACGLLLLSSTLAAGAARAEEEHEAPTPSPSSETLPAQDEPPAPAAPLKPRLAYPTKETPTPGPALAPSVAAPPTATLESSRDTTERERPSDAPSSKRKFYGHEIIIADGIADTSLLAGGVLGAYCIAASFGTSDQEWTCAPAAVLLVGGVGTHFLAPPIIHGTHGRLGAAFGSLGLRIGLPLLGAYVASASNSGRVGFLAVAGGFAAARLIDWFVLAYAKPEMAPQRSSAFTLSPTLVVSKHDAGIGLRGMF